MGDVLITLFMVRQSVSQLVWADFSTNLPVHWYVIFYVVFEQKLALVSFIVVR